MTALPALSIEPMAARLHKGLMRLTGYGSVADVDPTGEIRASVQWFVRFPSGAHYLEARRLLDARARALLIARYQSRHQAQEAEDFQAAVTSLESAPRFVLPDDLACIVDGQPHLPGMGRRLAALAGLLEVWDALSSRVAAEDARYLAQSPVPKKLTAKKNAARLNGAGRRKPMARVRRSKR